MTALDARIADAAVGFLVRCGDALLDQAGAFSCCEAEAIAELMRAAGDEHGALVFLDTHADADDEGDDHTPLPLAADGRAICDTLAQVWPLSYATSAEAAAL